MSKWREHIKDAIKTHEAETLSIFKHLHKHPERSWQEYETTKLIKAELEKLGIEILDIGLETGVVGLLKGSAGGPCIALRADIDGVPMADEEKTDCEYRSVTPGIVHACGHDTHTASLLGAAKVLAEMKEHIRGSVKFLFQPAEEVNKGALRMIELGCMENPRVDAVFGLHCSPEVNVGEVAVKEGPLMAAVHRFYIDVYGKGGHGGIPQRNHDPVIGTAAIIQALQTVVSRESSPLQPGVLSICSMHAGDGMTWNVTPELVKLAGTCRSYDKELAEKFEPSMRRIINGVAEGYNLSADLEYNYDLPVTANPAGMIPIAFEAVESIGATAMNPIPSTGGEDFTFFMDHAPGFFYWLGVRNEEKGYVHPWHSPFFRADERCIAVGMGTYAASVFCAIEAAEQGTLKR